MLLLYVTMEDQDVDIVMKALTTRKFEYHRGRIRVKDNPFLVEREFLSSTRNFSTHASVGPGGPSSTYTSVGPQVLAAPTLVWAKFGAFIF